MCLKIPKRYIPTYLNPFNQFNMIIIDIQEILFCQLNQVYSIYIDRYINIIIKLDFHMA